jgi:hypothetical protein
MGTMEEAVGSGEGAAAHFHGAEAPRLGFSAGEVVDAALVQDEIDYAARMAIEEAAAMRHVGKDPRDLDPRDPGPAEML